MNVQKTKRDGVIILKLPETFDFKAHRSFRDAYQEESRDAEFEVNLAGVSYLDSSALGMLLLLRQHCGDDDARIAITNATPTVMNIFKVAKFDRYFKFV